jgi:hypothetical protein
MQFFEPEQWQGKKLQVRVQNSVLAVQGGR